MQPASGILASARKSRRVACARGSVAVISPIVQDNDVVAREGATVVLFAIARFLVALIIMLGLNGDGKAPVLRRAYAGFIAIVVVVYGGRTVHIIQEGIARPPLWDFFCFWLDGRVALLLRDVYAPVNFHALGDSLRVPQDFLREFLDVGFLYPPPSIVWFAPLGLFADVHSAIVAWYVFLIATAAGAVYLLWSILFRDQGPLALAAIAALVLIFPSSNATLEVTQTMFLALTFVLLFMRERSEWRAGLWIALAISVKPFLAFLLICPIVMRAWKALASTALSMIALTAVALLLIGPASFMTFVRANPASRVPPSLYTELSNQSLLSWILRLTHRQPGQVIVRNESLYLLVAGAIVLATVALCIRAAKIDRDTVIVLALLVGLLVYPQTLYFYALLLLVPIGVLCKRRATSGRGGIFLILYIAALICLLGYARFTYAAIASVWIGFATLAVWPKRHGFAAAGAKAGTAG